MANGQNLPVYALHHAGQHGRDTRCSRAFKRRIMPSRRRRKAYPDGLWLIFGGRTNGLHNFTPSGVTNFPPDFQNEDIIVINPANWQTWSVPWSQTDVPVAVYNSLSSAAQEFYQKGNTLYTVGGYSVPDTINFTGDTTERQHHGWRRRRRRPGRRPDASRAPGFRSFSPNSQNPADVTITAVGSQHDHDQPARHRHGATVSL